MCTTEGKTTNIVDSGSSGSTYYNSKYNKGIRTKTQSEVTRCMTNVRETRKTPTLTPTYIHTHTRSDRRRAENKGKQTDCLIN